MCMTYVARLLYCMHWTILGTENEQLTLLQLFHEALSLCMLKLYHVSSVPQDVFDTVFSKNLDSNQPIKRLYYSAKFVDICIHVHCSSGSVSPWNDTEEFYPQCQNCSKKIKVSNVKALRKKPLQSNSLLLRVWISMFYMVMSQ